MAHRGQELRLLPRRLHGRVTGGGQLELGASRSATRPIWTPTCSTIAVIMSWRYSGGADLIAMTAQTSSAYETGKAIVSRASSHTEARSWKARLASELGVGPGGSSASASRSSSWM